MNYPENFMEIYEEFIRSNDRVFIDNEKALKLLNYNKAVYVSSQEEVAFLIRMNTKGNYTYKITPAGLLDFVIDELKINPNLLRYQKRLSMEMKHVILPLLNNTTINAKQRLFLSSYVFYKSVKANIDTFKSKLERCSNSPWDGIKEMHFNVELQSTGRAYYNDEAVLSIPKEYLSTLCASPGKLLAWGDFKQSDLRIAYNLYMRNEDNEKYFENEEDYYRGFLNSVLEGELDEKYFKENRDNFKPLVLAACYGGQYKTLYREVPNNEVVNLTLEFYKNNERYQSISKEFQKAIDFGAVLKLRDYFGFPRDIAIAGYGNFLNQALNTPIQTTTNSVVANLCIKVMEECKVKGIDKNVQAYIVRHDEPVFMFDEAVKEEFKEILSRHQVVRIDNWFPLGIDFHIGRNYKEKIDSVVTKGEWKLEVREEGLNNFFPVKRVLDTEFVMVQNDNGWKAGFLTKDFKVISTGYVNTKDQVINRFNEILSDYCEQNNYGLINSQLCIEDPEIKENIIGDLMVKYMSSYNHTSSMVKALNGECVDYLTEIVK